MFNTSIKILIFSFALLTLPGCATIRPPAPPAIKTILVPNVGEVAVSNVGQPILEQGRYAMEERFKLNDGFEVRDLLAKIIMSPGQKLQRYEIDGRGSLCSDDYTFHDFILGPIAPACLQDRDGDGAYDYVMYKPDASWGESPIPKPVTVTPYTSYVSMPEAYRFELIYEGHTSDGVRVMYREYKGDMIRQAFAQSAIYPMQTLPMVIKFKSSTIKILELNGSDIKYIVESGFDN